MRLGIYSAFLSVALVLASLPLSAQEDVDFSEVDAPTFEGPSSSPPSSSTLFRSAAMLSWALGCFCGLASLVVLIRRVLTGRTDALDACWNWFVAFVVLLVTPDVLGLLFSQ